LTSATEIEWVLCEHCASVCPGAEGDEIEEDTSPSRECSGCGSDNLTGGVYVTHVVLPDDFISELHDAIYACECEGCGGGHYDHEDDETIGAETNASLRDVIYDHAASKADEPFYALIAALAEADNDLKRLVERPGLSCRGCGAEINDWYTEVKVRTYQVLVPRLHDPPEEIRGLPTMTAAARIEWWRTDSSIYLTHLTRRQRLATRRDNIDYEDRSELVPAPEVLWAILSDRILRARKGKGLYERAVCFTEKPLAALKDTILGDEARVRRGTRSIAWSAYGVMFEKEYLRGLGVRPVLHLDEAERAALPANMAHRAVPFREGVNWLHEREWRAPSDVTFDLSQCIVLVPTFEQAELYREALAKRSQRVRGFVALHDLFAAL